MGEYAGRHTGRQVDICAGVGRQLQCCADAQLCKQTDRWVHIKDRRESAQVNRQADRQVGRQVHIQTGVKVHREACVQVGRYTVFQVCRYTDVQLYRQMGVCRCADRHKGKFTGGQIDSYTYG